MEPPVHMNLKKIRRLMKKYGLFCPIRKANPYRRMAKALATSYVAPNSCGMAENFVLAIFDKVKNGAVETGRKLA